MRSVPYNINRTIWENTERSRDAEIFKKKYQSCNKYIYYTYFLYVYNYNALKGYFGKHILNCNKKGLQSFLIAIQNLSLQFFT